MRERIARLRDRLAVALCLMSWSHFIEPFVYPEVEVEHRWCSSCTWCVECGQRIGRVE